ncbi:MAG TPA: DUF4260 domain-containing protein [Devosiaceae bacterium]|jgi:hypothetical protein|nr:DUF4260 domain-containing protein [Devosiaceae bacterium]
MSHPSIGFPPGPVATTLRIEGAAVLVAALVAYQFIGGDWWLFALLILAPDLSMFGALRGQAFGAHAYNAAHTYTVPAAIGALAWFAGAASLVPFALVWIAHIGMDRALGYGLKYPDLDHHTHLGLIGKARKRARLADAS